MGALPVEKRIQQHSIKKLSIKGEPREDREEWTEEVPCCNDVGETSEGRTKEYACTERRRGEGAEDTEDDAKRHCQRAGGSPGTRNFL